MQPIISIKNWVFGQTEKKTATIKALVIEETVKTIQIIYKNQTVWLQKSLINLEQNQGNMVTIIIPHWLFSHKFTRMKPANRRR
jgi:RNase P/RNase MRP subunit p29